MNDIIVGHVAEDTAEEDLRLFLRVLHRSGVTSKCDVVFVLASSSHIVPRFSAVVREENDSFLSLIELHSELNSTRRGKDSESRFDVTRFIKVGKKNMEMGETVWGKRIRSNLSDSEAGEGELTRLSYGSVLSFDASELDPENSMAGFLDRVPLSLRRWACYPMLLGRVRRNFKHVMLVDVKNVVIFNDPLGRVRNRSADSVFLYAKPKTGSSRHGKKNSARTQSLLPVNSAIVMGGARGVRRLSNAMLIEIVRAAMQHKKKKNSVSESAILSQLVLNEFALKNIDFVTPSESIPETSSVAAHNNSAGFKLFSDKSIIQRSTSNYDLNSVIKKEICSSVVDSSVYRDC